MDVSDQDRNNPLEQSVQSEPSEQGPRGEELIGTVVSLTGLPGALVQEEMAQILEHSGQSSGTVTLESLREAMLIYLQSVAETMALSEDSEGSQEAVNDLPESRIGAERLTLVTK